MNEDVIDLKKYLEGIRGRLLDLGLRNRLLNFKPSKGKVISLTTAHPDELYKELSVGNKIVFRSLSFVRRRQEVVQIRRQKVVQASFRGV